jgi:HSP20 family protein
MANNVVRYNQSPTLATLSDAVDQMFRDTLAWPRMLALGTGARTGLSLDSNLYETSDSYVLQAVLPGASIEALQITAHRNVVALSGKSEIPSPEGARGLWVTLRGGEFREQITLPGEVDADRASADYRDGILTITLPKIEHTRAKSIKITAAAAQNAIEGSSEVK